MNKKIISMDEAAKMIADEATICFNGFVGCVHPEGITKAIEKRFLENGAPRNLTLIYAAGQGDGQKKGMNHLGHEGLLKRIIGGHWGLAPALQKLAVENKVEAYNFPQGVIGHMMRDTAAGKPGTLTHIGLNTFVDPSLDGGKVNEITKTSDDLVLKLNVLGKSYLFYKAIPIDYTFVRATYADTDGNASFEHECAELGAVSMCQAAKNSGGKVILQVEKVVPKGSLQPRLIKLPGIYVDAIVIAEPSDHMQTFATMYEPGFSGECRTKTVSKAPVEMDIKKIIARRCALELKSGAVVNLGIGIPEKISSVASEEGISEQITLTVESGLVGGIPAGGLDFGASLNYDCMLDEPAQFDFYDGGGLDLAFLGLAQVDRHGNVNVSKFGTRIAGCGGFINITQTAKRLIYAGTFTAGGLHVEITEEGIKIVKEGKNLKFLSNVEQITFSGKYAMEKGQEVLYITERAVFRLTPKGLELTEIAPGINMEQDILKNMEFKPLIAKDLKKMDDRIFRDKPMKLTL